MGRPHGTAGRFVDDLGLRHAAGKSMIVVALPAEDDPVQKVSSEKVPHLTLLYLGDPGYDQTQIDLVAGFVEHAASLISQFSLDVESRGVLGDQNADVLFFDMTWAKPIQVFRDQLLMNDLVKTAFLSTDQFPQWAPHLTLGYPTSPAKKVPYDAKYATVNFDRIALWTGDYSGPTFQLKRPSFGPEVAMSQIERGRAFVEGMPELAHYGVKGMKWGRRKDKPAPHPASEDHVRKMNTKHQIQTSGVKSLSNQELRNFLERVDLEQRYSKIPKKKTASSEAAKIIKDVLINVGKQEATKIIAKQVGKTVLKVGLG
jgi:2'-5' RNA ligase